MTCEKCMREMYWTIEGATQGWRCPDCGWSIITTYIDPIYSDVTEYSLYVRNVLKIDREKIKLVAKTAGVNFIIAKQMLEENNVCILKAKAPEIKAAVVKLRELGVDFNISPTFRYI